MSTNFYWTPPAKHPHSAFGRLHIGKRSGGWSFMFQGYEYKGGAVPAFVELAPGLTLTVPTDKLKISIRSWQDWLALLNEGGQIHDEYDGSLTLKEFKAIVEEHYSPTSTFNGNPVGNHTEYLRKDPRYSGDPRFHDETQYWVDAAGYSFSAGDFS